MNPPHLVTDIDVYFRGIADPVSFTCDDARGDVLETAATGDRLYRLQVRPGLEEVHIISAADVRYMRLTQRFEDAPAPVYAGDGVTVIGELPAFD